MRIPKLIFEESPKFGLQTGGHFSQSPLCEQTVTNIFSMLISTPTSTLKFGAHEGVDTALDMRKKERSGFVLSLTCSTVTRLLQELFALFSNFTNNVSKYVSRARTMMKLNVQLQTPRIVKQLKSCDAYLEWARSLSPLLIFQSEGLNLSKESHPIEWSWLLWTLEDLQKEISLAVSLPKTWSSQMNLH